MKRINVLIAFLLFSLSQAGFAATGGVTPTTTALTVGPNPQTPGLTISMVATVSPSTVTGTVLFFDGGLQIASVHTISGRAIHDTSTLLPGTHYITAMYTGDATYAPSTSPVVIEVIGTPTTTSLTASPSVATLGSGVTLIATPSTPSATGTVTFYSSVLVLGTAPIVNGSATLTTTQIPAGTQPLFARYSGDSVNGSSLSSAVTETVLAKPSGGLTTGSSYPLPPPASAVTVADFNHDSRSDVAVVSGSTLSIFLGNGDATFRTGATYSLTAFGVGIAAGDFNGDGVPDLAVAVTTGVFVLTGNGDGTFQVPIAVTLPTGTPTSLVVADFNIDGRVDIAVGFQPTPVGTGQVAILYSNGNNTFQTAQTINTVTTPGALAVGDFNNDGVPDLAAADPTNNVVAILMGGFGGGLGPVVQVSIGINPTSLAIADFNGDGFGDLVATNTSQSTVSVLPGKGDGTFLAPLVSPSAPTPTAVSVGDFNGDGKLDVAVVTSAGVGMQFGNGNGTFQAPVIVGAGTTPAFTAVSDLNNDGATDLVVAGSTALTILVGTPSEVSSVAVAVSPQTSLYGQAVTLTATVAPFTATGSVTFYDGATVLGTAGLVNGVATLTTAALTTGTRSISARYSGDASNQASVSSSVTEIVNAVAGGGFSAALGSSSNSGPYAVGAGDFNRDGQPDLAVANYSANSVGISLGNNNGTFTSVATLPVGANPTALTLGDFNRDGNIDIAVANSTGNSVSILLGHGDGTFSSAVNYPVTAPAYLASGDFNNDGRTDLAIAGSAGVSILLGNGDGTFLMVAVFPAGNLPYALAVGDFNGDGKTDLVVSNRGDNTVSILNGTGDGHFSAPANISVGIQPAALAVADFNGDGFLDFAVTSLNTSSVLLYYGTGAGTFTAGTAAAAVSGSAAIASVDFNGDGKPDLAVANTNSNSVSVLINAGNGSFSPAINYTTGSGPISLAIADFNADSRPDLAVANYSANTLSILLDAGAPVSAVQGSSQSANLNTAFALPLEASVTGFGAPLAGTAVTFTAPATGPSGTFSGALTATVITGADGIAIAPTFTANSIIGSYAVTASVGSSTATFSLSNMSFGCSFTITPNTLAYDDAGGTTTLNVTASSSNCAWTAMADSSWILLGSTTGTGNGSVSVTISANTTGVARYGNVIIAGQDVAVTSWGTAQVFTDVPPSAYYFDAVNLLFAKGITSGCGPSLYCPTTNVTRAEMAIFIVRAVIGSDNFTYSPVPYFADVQPTDFGFAWIQKLYELSITGGCGNGNYCPSDSVTRDEMAILVIRARLGATVTFEYPTTPYFTDVPSSYFAFAWIQRLKQDQITAGCSPTLYCPTSFVTRGDMAIFIMRGEFNQLLPAGTPVVTAVSPNTLAQGATATFTVTGLNTTFAQGVTTLAPIPGVAAGPITVTSPTSFTVQLTASITAALQPDSITAVTGAEQAVLPNGLVIVP